MTDYYAQGDKKVKGGWIKEMETERVNIQAAFDLINSEMVEAVADTITNTAAIASNVAAIASNVSAIAANVSAIATNVAGIATNVADIATNAAGIATNVTGIATNVADIATNAAGIATNVTNIGKQRVIIAVSLPDLASAATKSRKLKLNQKLTALEVSGYCSQATGTTATVNVLNGGVTILDAPMDIKTGAGTAQVAAIAGGQDDLADDAEIEFHVEQTGSGATDDVLVVLTAEVDLA